MHTTVCSLCSDGFLQYSYNKNNECMQRTNVLDGHVTPFFFGKRSHLSLDRHSSGLIIDYHSWIPGHSYTNRLSIYSIQSVVAGNALPLSVSCQLLTCDTAHTVHNPSSIITPSIRGRFIKLLSTKESFDRFLQVSCRLELFITKMEELFKLLPGSKLPTDT